MRERGFTLLEVLMGFAVLGIILYSGMLMFSVQFGSIQQQDRQKALVDLVESNLIELNAKPLSSLPPVGQCRARYYNVDGTFQVEGVYAVGSLDCRSSAPSSPGFKVVLTPEEVDPSSVSFTNADGSANSFLKLPVHVKSIKTVRVSAGAMIAGSGKELRVSMTVYKQ